MKDILADSSQTSIRLVVNPEKMVIKEAQRAFTFFNLFGYMVDLIIVNRIIPAAVKDLYFQNWKALQAEYQQMIRECFSPIPILSSDLFPEEIVGKKLLAEMAKKVYSSHDPTKLFFNQKPIIVEKTDSGFDLLLHLPFVTKKDIELAQKEEELSIKAGQYKRNILLPPTLLSYSVKGAKFERQKLRIYFRH